MKIAFLYLKEILVLFGKGDEYSFQYNICINYD